MGGQHDVRRRPASPGNRKLGRHGAVIGARDPLRAARVDDDPVEHDNHAGIANCARMAPFQGKRFAQRHADEFGRIGMRCWRGRCDDGLLSAGKEHEHQQQVEKNVKHCQAPVARHWQLIALSPNLGRRCSIVGQAEVVLWRIDVWYKAYGADRRRHGWHTGRRSGGLHADSRPIERTPTAQRTQHPSGPAAAARQRRQVHTVRRQYWPGSAVRCWFAFLTVRRSARSCSSGRAAVATPRPTTHPKRHKSVRP